MKNFPVTWRLEGGYSRFLEGSRVDLRLQRLPATLSLDLSPAGVVRRNQPVELLFRLARTVRGELPGGLRWRLTPEAQMRARLLFPGNAYLGNFRVPPGRFGVEWDVEAQADSELSRPHSITLLCIEGGARWRQTWIRLFPSSTPPQEALIEAWALYRNPLDAFDAFLLEEGQHVYCSWRGRLQLSVGFQWNAAAGWTIPESLPLIQSKLQATVSAGLSARFEVSEEGQFALQLRKQKGNLLCQLRRKHGREHSRGFFAGVRIQQPVRLQSLGFSEPGPWQVVSEGLSRPLVDRVNRACEEALARRLETGLSIDSRRQRTDATILRAVWLKPEQPSFIAGYGQLLRGQAPAPSDALRVTGRLETVRGRQLAIHLNLLDWVRLGHTSERTASQVVSLGPAGEVLIESGETFEKTDYRWDEIQLLKLWRGGQSGYDKDEVWTWGREDQFSRLALRHLLRAALHLGMIPEFELPAKSAFPIRARLLFVTRFTARGFEAVRTASSDACWEGLVKALELADPDRYGAQTFWRDWIDAPAVRERVDEDPVQADLLTRYPVPGRSQFERTGAVVAYRKAKRFLNLLQIWRRGDWDGLLPAFRLGMDVPIFLFFHLLCPVSERSSAALLTGDLERTWGAAELLRGPAAAGWGA